MRVPRTRGAASGIILIILGAWVALIPFVGPLFDYTIGSSDSWHWTAGRFWLNVLPGAVTILAGVVVLGTDRRASIGTAGWTAAISGLWIAAGPEVSRIWNDGVVQSGPALGSTNVQVAEILGYSLVAGGLITAIGSFVLGRSSVASVHDLRYDADLRERELASLEERDEVIASREAARSEVRPSQGRSGRHVFRPRTTTDNSDPRMNATEAELEARSETPLEARRSDSELHHTSGGDGRN